MAKCLVCKKTIYYTFRGQKKEYEPPKGKDAICAMCVIDRMNKRQEQDKIIKTLTEAPQYSDKQLEAMYKIMSKDEERKAKVISLISIDESNIKSQPKSTVKATDSSVDDLLAYFDDVKL